MGDFGDATIWIDQQYGSHASRRVCAQVAGRRGDGTPLTAADARVPLLTAAQVAHRADSALPPRCRPRLAD